MNPNYPILGSPLRIGSMTVQNRMVLSAHLTNYAEDNLPSDRLIAYYEARAAGGVGLIITEEQSVHPSDHAYQKLIQAYREDVLPGYLKLTGTIHRHGTRILAQINHNGAQGSSRQTRVPLLGASPIADPLFREVPKAADLQDLRSIAQGYAETAERCQRGGFDGVELQCSHSSIVRQFLSPHTNHRTDEYGGSLDNRMRLLRQIISAIRDPALRRRVPARRDPAGRGRRDRGAARAGRPHQLHQHEHRRGHRIALPDRGIDAGAAGLRHLHSGRDPAPGEPPGRWRGSHQGPGPGGTDPGRRMG